MFGGSFTMQKRTTNFTFQKYGSVYYTINRKSTSLQDYELNDFKIENKSFDSFYYSSDPVYINAKEGIIMLVVYKEQERYEEYVVHRIVRLKPNVRFNYISISNQSVIQIYYSKAGISQVLMKEPYEYHPLVSKIDLKEILTCFYQVRKSNYVFPGESHDHYELTYIDHGCLDTTIDGQKYNLKKYDLILYYPGQFHTQSTDAENTCSYLTITFDLESTLGKSLKNRVFHTKKNVYQALTEFMKVTQNEGYMNDELSLLYLKQILIFLCQDGENEDEDLLSTNPMQEHYESALLNEILVYINNNIFKAFTVEDLCVKFSISRSSLQSLFKNNIYITPKQYISNVKLNQAKIMIHEHKHTISEISDVLGYTSIHYFSRKFKLQYGMSPTEYAKSIT